MELFPGAVVNLGFGVSNGISAVAVEEGFYREVTLTVEQGIIGGVPAVGKDAGAGVNYDMMADQPYQFDFYDGGGLDIAYLSFAEVDAAGNVNVSRYGKSVNGPGGFINISQGARKVVFSGTLTTGGLDMAPDGKGGLELRQDGRTQKWVPEVGQVTFTAPMPANAARRSCTSPTAPYFGSARRAPARGGGTRHRRARRCAGAHRLSGRGAERAAPHGRKALPGEAHGHDR
ncbi:MAG: hypothetical protein R3D28_20290 [Geminicoccaceae bacterium]